VTLHGFTTHEQLDEQRVLHMNGRAYDYRLGRFLSPDPIVSDPLDPQAHNPYSYVLNNPYAATDPTGFAPCGEMPGEGQSCEAQVSVTGSNVKKTYTLVGKKDSVEVFEGHTATASTSSSASPTKTSTPAANRSPDDRGDSGPKRSPGGGNEGSIELQLGQWAKDRIAEAGGAAYDTVKGLSDPTEFTTELIAAVVEGTTKLRLDSLFERAMSGAEPYLVGGRQWRREVASLETLEKLSKGTGRFFDGLDALNVAMDTYNVVTAKTALDRDKAIQELGSTVGGIFVERLTIGLGGGGPLGVAAGAYVSWAITMSPSYVKSHTLLGKGGAESITRSHPGCGATDSCPNTFGGKR
jgi:RHS repeat-associated protein